MITVVEYATPHLAAFLAEAFPERPELCDKCSIEREEWQHKVDCAPCKSTGMVGDREHDRCSGTGWIACPVCGPFVDLVLLRPLGIPVRVKQLKSRLHGLPDVIRACVDGNKLWLSKSFPIPECAHEKVHLNRQIEVLGRTNIYDGRTIPLFSETT